MIEDYSASAVRSAFTSQQAYCKFLSANDSGATGGHQSGILISKSAKNMLFSQDLTIENILKRTVEITWQDNISTFSCFTYYSSKNELRITQFGRGFPYLHPEQTGALFVLTKQSEEHYSGYFLETEKEIEYFLDSFGIGITETNQLINCAQLPPHIKESMAIQEFISKLSVDFPSSEVMSAAARSIFDGVYNHVDYIRTNPDRKLIDWTGMEYTLFRALEQSRYGEHVSAGFSSVDEFITMANQVLNRRKSRAGKSLEHHLSAIFDANNISYTPQATTEGNKKPDFLFPSQTAYHNVNYPVEKLISLAAKTTCKDRWRQVINEADRLRDKPKYLCTMQQGISPAQMDEMQSENVILVVPKPYISAYPRDRQDRIWTLTHFVEYIKEVEK